MSGNLSATPEVLQKLVKLLAASQRPEDGIRKPAEAQLKKLETVAGFVPCMLTVAMRGGSQVPEHLRQAAAIAAKNVVTRYWQNRQPGGYHLRDEDRAWARRELLSSLAFSLDSARVHRQVAVALAKVARFDWPGKWKELFPSILSALSRGNDLQLKRGLHALLELLRELVSRRFCLARRAFQQASKPLLSFLVPAWLKSTQQFFAAAKAQPEAEATVALGERALKMLQCLQLLTVYGIPDLSKSEEAKRIFPALLKLIEVLLPLTHRLGDQRRLSKPVRSLVAAAGGTALRCVRMQPSQFAPYLAPFARLFVRSLASAFDARREYAFERHTIQALNFLSAVLSCSAYRPESKSGGAGLSFSALGGFSVNPQAAARVRAIWKGIFTPQSVAGLTRLLISKLLVLTPSELEEWRCDPEDYVFATLTAQYGDRARPAGEDLFYQLCLAFPETVAPLVREALGAALARPARTEAAMLAREALYYALGVGAGKLAEEFKKAGIAFKAVFAKALAPDMANHPKGSAGGRGSGGGSTASASGGNSELVVDGLSVRDILDGDGGALAAAAGAVRAQAIRCVGEWSEEIRDTELRAAAYTQVARMLARGEPLVVRLTAARTLKSLLDDPAGFNPTVEAYAAKFLEPHCRLLFQLSSDTRSLEARKLAVEVLRQLVASLGARVKPVAAVLVRFLAQLWGACGKNDLLQNKLVDILTELVQALGVASVQMHSFLLPVLKEVTDPSDPARSYMMDHALELWQAVLRCAPDMTSDLAALFTHWAAHAANTTQNIEELMCVAASYVVLGRTPFLRAHGARLRGAVAALFDAVKPLGQLLITRKLVTIVQACSGGGSNGAQPSALVGEPLLATLLRDLSGARRQDGTRVDDGKVLRGFMDLVARLLFQDVKGVIAVAGRLSQGRAPAVLAKVMATWSADLAGSGPLYARKLDILAMLRCIAAFPTQAELLQQLASLLGHAGAVVAEEARGPTGSPPRPDAKLRGTEAGRLQAIYATDPLERVRLKDAIRSTLARVKQVNGPERFQAILNSIDPIILKSVQ